MMCRASEQQMKLSLYRSRVCDVAQSEKMETESGLELSLHVPHCSSKSLPLLIHKYEKPPTYSFSNMEQGR